jgi:hypothetical protein
MPIPRRAMEPFTSIFEIIYEVIIRTTVVPATQNSFTADTTVV